MKYKVKEGCTAKKGDWIYNEGAIIELTKEEFDDYEDIVEEIEVIRSHSEGYQED